MKEYKELELERYVIATLDNPTFYLVSKHFGKYEFTDKIQIATKTLNRKLAEQIKENYYHDTGIDIDLAVVKLKIEYTFINEEE